VDAYSEMELCTPIWLNHGRGDRGSCRYIGNGHIFRSGGMHAIFLIHKSFSKIFKTQMDTSLNKPQHKKELLCG
jgi:hypothetical protein